ncbi:unnamed protein product, partial [Adineta ricciae]
PSAPPRDLVHQEHLRQHTRPNPHLRHIQHHNHHLV